MWAERLRARLTSLSTLPVRSGAVLLFLVLFVAHLSLLRPLLQNGDSAVYNQQIDELDLNHRSTHVGYFTLGIVFNKLLPFGTDLNMNLMVLSVGFLGLAAVYSTTKLFSDSRLAASASVVLAFGLFSQVRGMLLSEVDGVSVAFVAMAFACFQRDAAWFAGLLFGFSVLVTPLSGPLLALFVVTAGVRAVVSFAALRAQVRKLLAFGAFALLTYVPPVAILFQDYVYGPRGLLKAPRSAFSVPQRIAQSWHFVSHELGYLLPLYAAGALLCLLSPRLWRAGQPALALLVSMALMAVVGQRFSDVPVQLPNLVLFGMLPAIAFALHRPAVKVGLGLLFCACFFNVHGTYTNLSGQLRSRERDRKMCLAIRAESAPRAPVLVGLSGWDKDRIFERFTSSPGQRSTVVDWRTFVRNQRRWLEPAQQVELWFFHPVKSSQVSTLLERYSLESRTVGTRKLSVLVPRTE
jgi:hypothetical protein